MIRNASTSRWHQRGSALLVVLAMGIVLAILASTSLLSTRNSLKVSGIQRRDYQDIHAAEAGIARTQHRLNQAVTLCSGYFSKQDYDAVVAAMQNAVYVLPGYYGPDRAVRVDGFEVLPGRPMRVRFNSTGGRWIDGQFDSSESHTLRATLRMSTLGDYASFVETGWGIAGAGVTNKGRIHAQNVGAYRNVTFEKEVTYTGVYQYFDTQGPNPIFKKGAPRLVSGNPFTLARVYIDNNAGSTCGANTYRDLAAGTVAGEGQGLSYTGATSVYLPLDRIRLVGSNVAWDLYEFDGTQNPPQGVAIANASVPASSFNGVLYSSQDVYVSGTLTNFSLTLTSGRGIYITDNIVCEGNEALNPDNRVTLGLISKNKLHYWDRCPTSISVEAAIVTPDSMWGVNNDAATHVPRDINGNTCDPAVASCWYFKRLGGAICKQGSSAGIFGSKTPRLYEFDPDMLYSPPPKFPSLYGQNGAVGLWAVAEWGER